MSLLFSDVNWKHISLLYSLSGLYLYSSSGLILTGVECIKFRLSQALKLYLLPYLSNTVYSIIGIINSSVIYSILKRINSEFGSILFSFFIKYSQSWISIKVKLSNLFLFDKRENWYVSLYIVLENDPFSKIIVNNLSKVGNWFIISWINSSFIWFVLLKGVSSSSISHFSKKTLCKVHFSGFSSGGTQK